LVLTCSSSSSNKEGKKCGNKSPGPAFACCKGPNRSSDSRNQKKGEPCLPISRPMVRNGTGRRVNRGGKVKKCHRKKEYVAPGFMGIKRGDRIRTGGRGRQRKRILPMESTKNKHGKRRTPHPVQGFIIIRNIKRG